MKTYHNGIQTRPFMKLVPHYWIPIIDRTDEANMYAASKNREIRNWCAQNLPDSSWETRLEVTDINGTATIIIGVYIDLEYPEAAMAVKLSWT